MNPAIFMLAGTDADVRRTPLPRPCRRQVMVSPGYNATRLTGFAQSRVGRDYSFRVAPLMPDQAQGPAYGAAHGLGLDPSGFTKAENEGLLSIGATIVSTRAQVESSPSYATPDGRVAKKAVLAALDTYTKQFTPLRSRVEARNYDYFGTNSVDDVNARLKRLKSDVEAMRGQVTAFTKKTQSGAATSAALKVQTQAVLEDEAARKKAWWDEYKTPVYVGAGLLAAGALVYLLGPAIRNIGGRATAAKAA